MATSFRKLFSSKDLSQEKNLYEIHFLDYLFINQNDKQIAFFFFSNIERICY